MSDVDKYGASTGVVVPEGVGSRSAATNEEEYFRHPPSLFTDDKGNLKFVNFVCRHPLKMLFFIITLCVLVVFALGRTVFSRGNPFNAEGAYDVSDVRSVAYDSLRLAIRDVKELRTVKRNEAGGGELESSALQADYRDVTYWVYEAEETSADDPGLFATKETIRNVREAVSLFLDDSEYDKYCWLKYEDDDGNAFDEPRCTEPLSPLNMYYSSTFNATLVRSVIARLSAPRAVDLYNGLSLCVEFKAFCELIPAEVGTDDNFAWARSLNQDMNTIIDGFDGEAEDVVEDFELVTTLAAYLMGVRTKKGYVDFGYDKNFALNNTKSFYSRTIVFWGGPYKQTLEAQKKIDSTGLTMEELREKEEELEEDDRDMLKDYIVDKFLKRMDKISSTDYHDDVNSYYFMGALILDVLLEIVIMDATKALYSLMFVFFWVAIMVQSWFLAVIGFLEIILSLPLAWFLMDVVFQVKYFSFLNALALFIVAAIGADDIFIFMEGYKQSAYQSPQVLESLESRMSWVYRRTGSAMATTSATTCAAFLCTLVTPLAEVRSFGIFAALVILMDYFLVMTLFCTAVIVYHDKFQKEGSCCCAPTCCMGGVCNTSHPSPTEKALERVRAGEGGEGNRITRFFKHQVTDFVTGSVFNRLIVGALFLGWVGAAISFTTKLKPTEQTEQFLDEDHPLQKSFNILGNEFPTADNDRGLLVYFGWGVGELDRSGVNLLMKPDFLGDPTLEESFKFDETCQSALLQVCDDLRQSEDYEPYVKYENGLGAVDCFVHEMGAYRVLGSLSDCAAVRSGSWKDSDTDWRVPVGDLPTFMQDFAEQISCYSGNNPERVSTKYADTMGWDGAAMRYAAVAAENAVVDPYSTLPEETVRVQYDALMNIKNDFDTSTVGDACGVGVEAMMSDLEEKFVFMNTQTIYVRSAVQSSFLGVAIAFMVLMLATRVLHLALLATLSIVCVLISITGSIVILGWQLGSIEAILISIVAGFSVDYVVHLAHAYERAKGEAATVTERIRSAFGEMGISVFNGMVTSVGASIPLFLCQLQFFAKFGTFLCLTIAFSWLFANFAFMSVLAQARIPLKETGKCRL